MIILSREQIILLHEKLIERYGGSHGIRDEGLLDSALNAPFQSFSTEFASVILDLAANLIDSDYLISWVKEHIK